MKITIEVIPHKDQRYETVGDWTFDDKGDLSIKVSELGNWRFNALVGLHELIEVLKCKNDGVTQQEVDDFDMSFEAARLEGDESEPGDSRSAPYYKQHQLATGIERIMAASLDVDWNEYEKKINAL